MQRFSRLIDASNSIETNKILCDRLYFSKNLDTSFLSKCFCKLFNQGGLRRQKKGKVRYFYSAHRIFTQMNVSNLLNIHDGKGCSFMQRFSRLIDLVALKRACWYQVRG